MKDSMIQRVPGELINDPKWVIVSGGWGGDEGMRGLWVRGAGRRKCGRFRVSGWGGKVVGQG